MVACGCLLAVAVVDGIMDATLRGSRGRTSPSDAPPPGNVSLLLLTGVVAVVVVVAHCPRHKPITEGASKRISAGIAKATPDRQRDVPDAEGFEQRHKTPVLFCRLS